MAMTFTIVSYLREQLSTLIRTRSERRRKIAQELERKALEAGLLLRVRSPAHPNTQIIITGRGGSHSRHTSDHRIIQYVEDQI